MRPPLPDAGRAVDTASCACCGSTRGVPAGRAWLLPALADHVRCTFCGRTYDAATGESNAGVFALYLLCLATVAAFALAAWAVAPLPPGP